MFSFIILLIFILLVFITFFFTIVTVITFVLLILRNCYFLNIIYSFDRYRLSYFAADYELLFVITFRDLYL